MANPGGVGSKFVSWNLNKSYGKPPGASSHGASPSGARFRSANHGSGGMVVLSRPRATLSGAPKAGGRLSVPPPLNLPSLRKEHERFDLSASGGPNGAGDAGSGSGHASASMGWTKPGFLEKDSGRMQQEGRETGSNAYMPPAARMGSAPAVVLPRAVIPAEKAVLLRGEDFPSLQASLPNSSAGPTQKQKDVPKQKQNLSKEVIDEKMENAKSESPLRMRPQIHSSRFTGGHIWDQNGASGHRLSDGLGVSKQSRKQDGIFSDPLPLVRLSHTSDWADDERDTGHSIPDRDRDYGFSRGEREYDATRTGLPRQSGHVFPDGRGIGDTENGKALVRGDTYGKDVRTSSREGRDGNSWRGLPLQKDGFKSQEVSSERNEIGARAFGLSRETAKHNINKYNDYGDSSRNSFGRMSNGNHESWYSRRDLGYGPTRQNGTHLAESFNGRGSERSTGTGGRYSDTLPKRYRGDMFQSSSVSFGSKGFSGIDPILNFGREKQMVSNSGKTYADNAFSSPGFDERDPFSGGLLFKKKKDVVKQTDFHDPIRESFEAELERVQMMQDQERQRVAEEQARALELARKEEEERQRLAREEEEKRRRLEEEAREAAWKAEQERLEAMRRAEEQRIAREEEKKRFLLEEERRKEAARKKLLELEARIARRQADSRNNDRLDEKMPQTDVQRVTDNRDWEDGERMVERITSSASSDSSGLNRTLETGTRPHFSRDGGTSILDRGKHVHSWKRDAFENANSSSSLLHDQYNGYHSPRRDLFGEGKSFPRKEFFGGPSVMPMRKGGISEPHTMDGLSQSRGQRWNLPMENVTYSRESEFDPEFSENPMDKFGDIGWGQSHSRDIPHSLNVDRYYQNPEVDGFSSFSRSRHLVRQPRVLPPPSIASMQSSFRLQSYRSGSPAFLDDEMRYSHGDRNENVVHSDYESGYQETLGQSEIINPSPQEGYSSQVQIVEKNTPRCDSQSSLSVTSPPNSPTHLSHDDLDDSGESQDPAAVNMTEQAAFSDSEQALSASEDVPQNIMTANSDPTADDEEWAIENSEELQEQEEYDEEEDGYQEEDEVHGDDENLDLAHEFADFHPEDQSGISKAEQLVLGFDEGVEVRVLSANGFEGPSNNNEKVESSDALVNNGQIVNAESNLYEEGLGNSDNKIQETGKALQDMVLHSTNTSQALDSVETSINSAALSAQQLTVPSTVNLTLPTQSVQPTPSTVSSVSRQTDAPPVKLQFGLFSGPSLIPSPVPAIQIGSIQMPLHLHPQVGSSITQIPPPQPPFFQFGQLRYTSPVSQGILPWGPRAMSFVQPSVPTPYSVNQHTGGFINNQAGEDPSANRPHSGNMVSSVLTDNQSGLDPKFLKPAHGNSDKEVMTLPVTNSTEKEIPSQNGAENPKFDGDKTVSPSIFPVEGQDYHNKAVKRNHKPVANNGEMRGQSSQFSTERVGGGSKSRGVVPGGKGKRFLYTARNASSCSPFPPPSEASHADSSGFQRRPRRNIRRTEFRVRENVDRRQSEHLALPKYPQQEEKSNTNGKVIGNFMRSSGKEGLSNKLTKPESESSLTSSSFPSRNIDSESKIEKANECSPSKRHISAVEGRTKVSGCLGDDVDPPLQSGVVRIFKQPGIEAPSDEDDFIEVRSKRQMLNDRREQKEKEIKAKSRVIKAPRKSAFQQSIPISSNSNRVDLSSLREDIPNTIRCETDVKGRGSSNVETPIVASIASAHLAPVGTSVLNMSQGDTSYHSMNSFHKGPAPVISNEGANLTSGLSFDNKNVVMEHVPTSLAPWANPRISQVMALTQTQLDEAMKPARFDARVAPISSETSVVLEPSKPSTSILPQSSKPFFSSARPLNYLLAGEKIQFGAVTSPTILPPSSLPVSNGIGATGLCGSDVSMDEKFSSAEGDSTIFFNKDKHLDKSCLHLEDPEAEAEAAASAVAVAAISNDEVIGSSLSASASNSKTFRSSEVAKLSSVGDGSGSQEFSIQSRAEESLSVALPADLSVETPSLSVWLPLPSPQNTSNPIQPPLPGAPHYPYYEMNPMVGGPIFAFGPHDESAVALPQLQKSSTSSTGPVGAWQQCHSGADSFYGPPTGFTGPFISPPRGIPGMQVPPHMVVYNHFAPLGQFGQVGLSFMGTTYIPSEKQPDWKHTTISSGMGISEGDSNMNMVPSQRNLPNIPGPMQHLAPGSSLLPMPSPLAMFDLPPFQSSTEMPMQSCWPHIPASPHHSVPLSMPLQQQVDGALPSQFNHGLPVDPSTGKRFKESRASTPADNSRNFPVTADATSHFPDELGLLDSNDTSVPCVSNGRPGSFGSTNGPGKNPQSMTQSTSRSNVANAREGVNIANNTSGSGNSSIKDSQSVGPMFKSQTSHQQTSAAYLHPIGYSDQRRSGVSSKSMPGGEWHRRVGFQGRNQGSGADKNFLGPSKVKRVYVAKSTAPGTPAATN